MTAGRQVSRSVSSRALHCSLRCSGRGLKQCSRSQQQTAWQLRTWSERPRPWYFFAMDTTRRMLQLTMCSRACGEVRGGQGQGSGSGTGETRETTGRQEQGMHLGSPSSAPSQPHMLETPTTCRPRLHPAAPPISPESPPAAPVPASRAASPRRTARRPGQLPPPTRPRWAGGGARP